MSHISTIELQVNDLSILGSACARLGLELIRSKNNFKWYGKEAPCDHAINVPQAEYEIGVIDRNGLYELNCDFYDRNLERVIGKNGGLLKQSYAVEKSMIEARRKGYSVLERKTETGIRLHVRIA
jgi:rRNA processing protein Krr1/Pno1